MFAQEHQTEETSKPLADIIREETDDGRLVVRFLIDIMQGKIDDSKPCHRLDAARQLLNLGFHGAQAVIQSVPQSTNGRAPSRAASVSRFDQGIADIIKLETSDGRDAVRFLVDVMQGNLDDFKPCHRIAAAKELLRRGFDSSPGHTNDEYEDHDESFDDDPGSPNYVDPNTNRYNNEDDSFDFESYDEEQFIRDRDGERALRHIYGSEEAVTIAHEAVSRHRQQALFNENYVPDRDFTPIENPEDDLFGKGHYGYNALRFVFDDNQSVGVANRTVEEFKKRMAEYDGPNDRPSCCYPGWSRDYALAAVRKSFEYPDRVEPQPDQTAENTDTGESQLVQSPEDPNPGNSESREPNRAKDPPSSHGLERSHVHPERSRRTSRANAAAPATNPEYLPRLARRRPAGRWPARTQRPRRHQNTAPQLAVSVSQPPITAPHIRLARPSPCHS